MSALPDYVDLLTEIESVATTPQLQEEEDDGFERFLEFSSRQFNESWEYYSGEELRWSGCLGRSPRCYAAGEGNAAPFSYEASIARDAWDPVLARADFVENDEDDDAVYNLWDAVDSILDEEEVCRRNVVNGIELDEVVEGEEEQLKVLAIDALSSSAVVVVGRSLTSSDIDSDSEVPAVIFAEDEADDVSKEKEAAAATGEKEAVRQSRQTLKRRSRVNNQGGRRKKRRFNSMNKLMAAARDTSSGGASSPYARGPPLSPRSLQKKWRKRGGGAAGNPRRNNINNRPSAVRRASSSNKNRYANKRLNDNCPQKQAHHHIITQQRLGLMCQQAQVQHMMMQNVNFVHPAWRPQNSYTMPQYGGIPGRAHTHLQRQVAAHPFNSNQGGYVQRQGRWPNQYNPGCGGGNMPSGRFVGANNNNNWRRNNQQNNMQALREQNMRLRAEKALERAQLARAHQEILKLRRQLNYNNNSSSSNFKPPMMIGCVRG